MKKILGFLLLLSLPLSAQIPVYSGQTLPVAFGGTGSTTGATTVGSGTYLDYLTAGVPGAATSAQVAAVLTGGSGTLNLSGYTLSLTSGQIPTLNQATTNSAASLSISGQTGLLTFAGLTSTNRILTIRDAADTVLELGGSYTPTGTWTSLTMVTPVLGTPTSGTLTNCTFPTLNQNTTGSAASLSVSGQTGLVTLTGTTSTNRIKTVRDAADTILELGGAYTPTGNWTNMLLVTPHSPAGTPSAANGTHATTTVTGTNAAGTLQVVIATGASTGVICTITLANSAAYPTQTIVQLTPANSATADLLQTDTPYCTGTTTTFVLNTSGTGVPIGTYLWNYTVSGY